jgi:hypothetical protein
MSKNKKTCFLYLHNTYRLHITTVYDKERPSLPFIGPKGTYFNNLLELLLKQAKVEGCKPSFKAGPSLLSIGPRGAYFGKLLEILLTQAKVDGCKPSFQARLRKLAVCISPNRKRPPCHPLK